MHIHRVILKGSVAFDVHLEEKPKDTIELSLVSYALGMI